MFFILSSGVRIYLVVNAKSYAKNTKAAQKLNKPSSKEVGLAVRIAFTVTFFILGFNLSRSAFFMELPFFGYHTLLEILISSLAAVFGFYVFPFLLVQAWYSIQILIENTVSDIVSSFWEQQSKRLQEARREKEKRKAEEEALKVKHNYENAVVLDTSVLIDGRILDITKTGFLDKVLIVPQYVITELQTVADSKDKVKRQRGRRGLDIVRDLKRLTEVIIPEVKSKGKSVDQDLVNYAKTYKVKLMTMDFNLNKVATVAGVKVLNINDLLNALKTVMLPGEDIKIKIIQEGKEKEQGIGYLPDGTMIVVEKAKFLVGQEVSARVSKVIQSSAGRMIFCNLSPEIIETNQSNIPNPASILKNVIERDKEAGK